DARGGRMSRPRRKRGVFNLLAVRRSQIVRHAKDVGAADTEDFWRWLVAWRWHNRQNGRDPVGALTLAAERMGGSVTEDDVEAILERADAMRQCRSADKLARFLGVTYAQRERLGLNTIGSIDVDKRCRTLLRRHKKRRYDERKRRARGARPRTEYEESSLMRAKPWEAEGISRATWYRRRRETSPHTAIPPLKDGGSSETSPHTAILSSGRRTPVSPERKQEAFRGGTWGKGHGEPSPTSLVLEGGLLLTRRWIAARKKACGLRHSLRLPADLCQEAAE